RPSSPGAPGNRGKATDHSGPVGPIHPVSAVGRPANGVISLTLDAAAKKKADLSDMISSMTEQIACLST
ncbi:MAG: fumarylacetoacetate hydrolase, partial [Microvirga sp.]|nr:fumarylacetoacetate hydrolase [Microvirga sp.]